MILSDLSKIENLTNSEQILAKYIIANPKDIIPLSSRELADKVYISAPTVIRLCKKLGFPSYSSFKLKLSEESSDDQVRRSRVDFDMPFKGQESKKALIERMSDIAIASIQNTQNNMDLVTLERISRLIIKKKKVDVYGTGHSLNSSREFCEKMGHIGYFVHPISDHTSQISRTLASDSERIAILISYSGKTKAITRLAAPLKEQGVTVIAITGNRMSPMLPYADYKLFIDSSESLTVTEKADSFGALYSLHYILDCLFTMIFSMNYDEHLKKAQDYSAFPDLY